jgi:hypothetical protein
MTPVEKETMAVVPPQSTGMHDGFLPLFLSCGKVYISFYSPGIQGLLPVLDRREILQGKRG